jgi:hypothetical protein
VAGTIAGRRPFTGEILDQEEAAQVMATRQADTARLVRVLEREGWTAKITKSGWRLLHPGGETMCLHRSGGSDVRAQRNTLAAIRRVRAERSLPSPAATSDPQPA